MSQHRHSFLLQYPGRVHSSFQRSDQFYVKPPWYFINHAPSTMTNYVLQLALFPTVVRPSRPAHSALYPSARSWIVHRAVLSIYVATTHFLRHWSNTIAFEILSPLSISKTASPTRKSLPCPSQVRENAFGQPHREKRPDARSPLRSVFTRPMHVEIVDAFFDIHTIARNKAPLWKKP